MKNRIHSLTWVKSHGKTNSFPLTPGWFVRLPILLLLACSVLPSVVFAQGPGLICPSVDISSNYFLREGGTGIINLCGDTDWRIDNPANWITFRPISGRGRGKATFYVAPNPGAPRSVNVLIKGQVHSFYQSDMPKEINPPITRLRDVSRFSFDGSIYNQPSRPMKQHIKLDSNEVWKLRSNQPWLKIQPEQGIGDAIITITADLNLAGLDRRATISVYGIRSNIDTLCQLVEVNQYPSPRAIPNSELLRPELFDADFYLRVNEEVRVSVGISNHAAAINHWVTRGIYEGRTASPIFSAKYYLAVHSDLKATFGDTNHAAAIVHWLAYGQREGRRSSPMFHPRHYLGLYPDLQRAFGKDNFASALQHFRTNGLNEGREASPWLALDWYLANNPDVAQAVGRKNFRGGLLHWLNNGRGEGRAGSPFGRMIPFGPIQDKWEEIGGSQSVIGNPINTTVDLPKNNGKFNHFERGSIYWSPQTGAFEVHGIIRDKWASLGWEWSVLGYPTSDETPTANGSGRFSRFEHGSIYWTPQPVPLKFTVPSARCG